MKVSIRFTDASVREFTVAALNFMEAVRDGDDELLDAAIDVLVDTYLTLDGKLIDMYEYEAIRGLLCSLM